MTSFLLTFVFFAQALPSGEAVLAKFIEATGGRAEYAKIHTTISTGRLEMPAQGIKGTITIYEEMPGKQYSVADIPGIGLMEDGTDGTIAWSKSALQGARLKQGEEKAAAFRAANSEGRFVDWRRYYKSVETVGSEDVDGKPCYKVVMMPIEGKPETGYYEKSSGLLVKETMVVATPMGDVPVESNLSDYRKEGQLLVPHKLKQSAVGQQFQITIESVKVNAGIPKERFDPPAEVKALLKK
jgi:zinc protease